MSAASRCCLLLVSAFCIAEFATAQYYSPYDVQTVRSIASLDWSISARGMALGEATVALPGYEDPFASNPAGLVGNHGYWVNFARQPFWLNLSDAMQYRSLSIGGETPFGVFLGTYRRLDYGPFGFTSLASPEPVAETRAYDYTIGLAWGYAIDKRFSVGVGAKLFNQKSSLEWGQSSPQYAALLPESDPAYLFDIGVLCNLGSLLARESLEDNLSLGLAVQGFGTPFRLHYTGTSSVFDPGTGAIRSTTQRVDYSIPLPRNLRIGFAYRVVVRSEEPEGLAPFSCSVMGEYRDLLNANMQQGGSYWGMGVEVSLFEVVQLRGGGLAEPYDGVFGNRNTLHGRYGVGVHLPINRIAPGLPSVVLEGSYSMMQLVNWDPSMLRAYSVGIRFRP